MGRPRIDLVGHVFSRLTIISLAGITQLQASIWQCKCVCGQTIKTLGNCLRRGTVKSCGCLRADRLKNKSTTHQANLRAAVRLANTTHGHAAKRTYAYRSWQSMHRRANNRYGDHPQYEHVSVCRRWHKYENFLADMGPRPANTSLSRFGDIGNYRPGNCAWHTKAQQDAEAAKKRLRNTKDKGLII